MRIQTLVLALVLVGCTTDDKDDPVDDTMVDDTMVDDTMVDDTMIDSDTDTDTMPPDTDDTDDTDLPFTVTSPFSGAYGGPGLDQARGIAIDSSGNTLLTGSIASGVDFGLGPVAHAGANDIFVAKFDALGTLVWAVSFGGTGDDVGHAITADSTGQILVAGEFHDAVDFGDGPVDSAGDRDAFLLKLDRDGNPLWHRTWGGVGDDRALDVAIDAQNHVTVVGSFSNQVDFGDGLIRSEGGTDGFLVQQNQAGTHGWSATFGDEDDDATVAVATDGLEILLAGHFSGRVNLGGGGLMAPGLSGIAVVRLDSDGAHIWSQAHGGDGHDEPTDIDTDVLGNVLLIGHTTSLSLDLGGGSVIAGVGGTDIFTAFYMANGAYGTAAAYGSPGDDRGTGIVATDNDLGVWVGTYGGSIDLGGGTLPTSGPGMFVAINDNLGRHVYSEGFTATGTVVPTRVAYHPIGNALFAARFSGDLDIGSGLLSTGDPADNHAMVGVFDISP